MYIKNLLKNRGLALIGYGTGSGEKKAIAAATDAISSPLIEASISGARRAIINITCGHDVTMFDIYLAIFKCGDFDCFHFMIILKF